MLTIRPVLQQLWTTTTSINISQGGRRDTHVTWLEASAAFICSDDYQIHRFCDSWGLLMAVGEFCEWCHLWRLHVYCRGILYSGPIPLSNHSSKQLLRPAETSSVEEARLLFCINGEVLCSYTRESLWCTATADKQKNNHNHKSSTFIDKKPHIYNSFASMSSFRCTLGSRTRIDRNPRLSRFKICSQPMMSWAQGPQVTDCSLAENDILTLIRSQSAVHTATIQNTYDMWYMTHLTKYCSIVCVIYV